MEELFLSRRGESGGYARSDEGKGEKVDCKHADSRTSVNREYCAESRRRMEDKNITRGI